MKLRNYSQMAGQCRPASVSPPMTSHYYQTGQSPPHWPPIIYPSSFSIIYELSTIDGARRIYVNFTKAYWSRNAEARDEYLAIAGEAWTVEQAEKTFRKAENKAIGIFILAGRIWHFQPTLLASAKSLADGRDRRRRQNAQLVVEDKRGKWQSAVDICDHRTAISHLMRFIKGLSGKTQHNSLNKGVRFAVAYYIDSK